MIAMRCTYLMRNCISIYCSIYYSVSSVLRYYADLMVVKSGTVLPRTLFIHFHRSVSVDIKYSLTNIYIYPLMYSLVFTLLNHHQLLIFTASFNPSIMTNFSISHMDDEKGDKNGEISPSPYIVFQ